jgi:ribosomal protein L37AE/L43A
MVSDHRRKVALATAINMINAERHEEAAKIYEGLGMFKEAGEVRRVGRRQVTTQVQVNVNDLMQQLRTMGVAANYTCPVCHSPTVITATTSPDALAKCQYCGAVARPTDIIEAITKVLGSR